MNNKEQNREKLELVEQTLWLNERYPTASAAADAAVYANESKHDAAAPTTNSRIYGADEKVC